MELTTGAILRCITETPLSVSAHKLATLILDGIAWKDGYNGLERGTAAFTRRHLAERMGGTLPARAEPEQILDPATAEVAALIRHVPAKNWRLHERDLQRIIGREACDDWVRAMQARLRVNRFAAPLAVHGEAVRAGKIAG